jgi:hypothetical protein
VSSLHLFNLLLSVIFSSLSPWKLHLRPALLSEFLELSPASAKIDNVDCTFDLRYAEVMLPNWVSNYNVSKVLRVPLIFFQKSCSVIKRDE